MKRKRVSASRKVSERKKGLPDHINNLRKRFRELKREEEEFRILALKKILLSSSKP